MLKIYKAVEIVGIIPEASGRTKPWVVLADTPQGITPFVVKLFTTNQIEATNCVTNEVVCNVLAADFDLKTPEMALIDIPESLVMRKNIDFQKQYFETDERLKFATRQLSNVNTSIKELGKGFYKKRIDLETLYAFDNMIRNADRGQMKTNLLINKDNAFLIDHELALKPSDINNLSIVTELPDYKFSKYHLFYVFLKKGKDKEMYFEEFRENINRINLSKLSPFYSSLENEGFETNKTIINNWISEIQRNSNTFVNNLRITLQ